MDLSEQKLRRPYPVNQLKWRPGPKGGELVYIDARDVMNRLDEVMGQNMWQSKFDWVGERMICTISCYCSLLSEWISKSDGADDSQIESAKGGCSDSFKRAGVHWGIGRYLYHPEAFDKNRNPAPWATPEGFDELMDQRSIKSAVIVGKPGEEPNTAAGDTISLNIRR